MNIKFSITIPAYKAKFLKEAIESCLAQTYRNFEIIIVDDASPEDLESIVKPYLIDSRVRYFRNEKNCGALDVVDNWNICLSYCTGEYVICMGDDDKLLTCCLEEYKKLIERYPQCGVYHAWTEIIDEDSVLFDIQSPRPEYETVYSLIWNRWNGRHYQFIGDWCYNVKQLREEGGYFKQPLAWASDDISAVRAALHNGVANTQNICFQYRMNRYTISLSGNSDIKIYSKDKEKKWYESLMKVLPSDNLTYEDTIYIKGIKSDINLYFKKERNLIVRSDIMLHPFRVFHWIGLRRQYNLPLRYLIVSFILSIFQNTHVKK